MPTTTSRLALPSPTAAESANAPANFSALTALLDVLAVDGQGTLAARPSAVGISGRYYWATDTSILYRSNGTAWSAIGPSIVGANSITATEIAANAVGSSELADDAVDTAAIQALAVTAAKIAAGTITAAQIAAALKPSGGAGGATEALRALGTTAGTALAGNAPTATPVAAVMAAGPISAGGTYTITAPAAGTYLLEWGAGRFISGGSGATAVITNSKTSGEATFADPGASGGPCIYPGVVLSNGEVITFNVAAGGFGGTLSWCWAKLTRTV
jgi:hypothetical protein